jgi:eukaryotic-like serine/threonine-protein kinase
MEGPSDGLVRGAFPRVARFRGRGLLGKGSLGHVYRAYDEKLGEEVALKTLPDPRAERIYYIKEEFRALTHISHPNLVELDELLVDRDHCFFTMELIDGLPFTEYVWAEGGRGLDGGLSAVGLARLRGAVEQLIEGIAALHRERKLHCDIKPTNILVTRGGRVVLLDFDMVRHFRSDDLRASEESDGRGTDDYASHEQFWSAPLSQATDWYSAGVVLFETLTGRLPFSGADRLAARERGAFPSIKALAPSTPDDLAALVGALLRPDPSRRAGEREMRRAAGAVAPPAGVADVGLAGSVFVGRAAEMGALRAAFDRTRRGMPAVVHIEGASGIGKSELVRRFLRWAHDDMPGLGSGQPPDHETRPLILRGACHVQESVSYRAIDGVIDELSRALLSLPRERAAALAPPQLGALMRLFPVLGRVDALVAMAEATSDDIAPQELRLQGFRALRELLFRLAAMRPLVIWIDDLQWGDADSAPLFRELLRSPGAPELLLLVSYRLGEREPGLLLDVLSAPELPSEHVHRIQLDPLDPADSRALARQLLDHALGGVAADTAELAAVSAGSPFFLVTLAQHAAEQLDGAPLEARSGDRLEQLLRLRVGRLRAGERRILEIVAVAGRHADRSLVLKVARLGQGGRLELKRLILARFVRHSETGDSPAVEIYHDRIRQAVLASMTGEEQRRCHLEIAKALADTAAPDLEALFEHYHHAGEERVAGRYAKLAGDRAQGALAFDRAAELYGYALTLGGSDAPRWEILEGLGMALANAGRGGEAGAVLTQAAALLEEAPSGASAAPARACELRRRAAEHYLRSGHFEPGITELRRVLGAVGVDYPRSSWRACGIMLVGRARITLRGLGFRERSASEIPRADLDRIEACWSAGLGLAWIDPMRTGAFQVVYTQLALTAGEPVHVSRALAVEASQLASYGGAVRLRRGKGIIAEARRVADASGDAATSAFVALMDGSIAFYDARWRDAVTLCEDAEKILRGRCRSPAWEMTTVHIFSLWSLVYLGKLAELGQSLPALLAEARGRGNLLGAASLALGLPNMVWLASDQPSEARAQAEKAIALWQQDTFQFQHYLHLVAAVQIDLYEGNGLAAWRRLTAAWPRVRSSFLLIIQNVRTTLLHLRARAAVAAAGETGRFEVGLLPIRRRQRREALLRAAERDAAKLEREDVRWAAPLAAAVRAQVAGARGRLGEAVATLERAERQFDGIDMALYAAAARHRRGALLGGERGERLRQESERGMRDQGVKRPDRLVAVLMPWVDG